MDHRFTCASTVQTCDFLVFFNGMPCAVELAAPVCRALPRIAVHSTRQAFVALCSCQSLFCTLARTLPLLPKFRLFDWEQEVSDCEPTTTSTKGARATFDGYFQSAIQQGPMHGREWSMFPYDAFILSKNDGPWGWQGEVNLESPFCLGASSGRDQSMGGTRSVGKPR